MIYLHMSSNKHVTKYFEITMFFILYFSNTPWILSCPNPLVIYLLLNRIISVYGSNIAQLSIQIFLFFLPKRTQDISNNILYINYS